MSTKWIHTNLPEEIKKAVGDVKRYDSTTEQKLRDAIRTGTEDTMRAALRHIHSYTGNLASNIEMHYNETTNTGYVKSKAYHSWLVERGAKATFEVPKKRQALKYGDRFFKLARIPARKPHPFMQPAAEEVAPKIAEKVQEAIEHD